MPTSSIGDDVQMIGISFINDQVVDDSTFAISENGQSSSVFFQTLHISHGEALNKVNFVFAMNASLKHM